MPPNRLNARIGVILAGLSVKNIIVAGSQGRVLQRLICLR